MITHIAQTTYASKAIAYLAMLTMKNTAQTMATLSVQKKEGNQTSPVHIAVLEPAFSRFPSASSPLIVPPISVGMENATLVKAIP
jgi:L,D-peptidoglycan transpeptidase YkuD (ErfK/YbiS/YcfS/YnhG family)